MEFQERKRMNGSDEERVEERGRRVNKKKAFELEDDEGGEKGLEEIG